MLRDLVKRALGAAGRTGVGKNLVNAAVQADPGLKRYPSVERWPESLDGFEDLAFLFSSNQLSHGIASLQLDEAALLYGLARRVEPGAAVAEIGRFKGGTTLMLASALPDGAELWSYDLHVAIRADLSGPQLDSELRDRARPLRALGPRPPRRRRLAHRRAAAASVRARLRRRRPHLRGRPRRLRALGRARRRPAGTCSSTTRSTSAATGTTTRGSRGSSARSSGTTREFERRPDAGSIAHFTRRALMNLVAVVLSYNGREDTLAALESLRGIETVVVDNGSTDGSADAVAERFPDVELVRAGVNLGFAGGNNVGIRRALDRGADWVLLVNNDAEVEPGLVDALAAAAAARPDAGVLACKVLFADSGRLWYAGAGFDPILGRSRHEGFGDAGCARQARGHAPRHRRRDGRLAGGDRGGRAARRGALPLRRGSRVEPPHPRRRLRGRLRAGGEGPPPRLQRRRRRGLADDELLRDAQHARRRRALPAAAARPDGRAARARRHAARRARGAPAGFGLGGAARLARLPPRANGASGLAFARWRTSAAASTAASSSSCSRRASSAAR